MTFIELLKVLGVVCLLSGCASTKSGSIYYGEEPYVEATTTLQKLKAIPELDQPQITIAVYNFPDKTGQRKPNPKFSQLSTAVTQGAEVWVIQALKEVSEAGPWFRVVEREGLDSLVKERQLIRSTRELYDGESDTKNVLKPLVFAGLIVEGGIVGYDSNVTSGGEGARYFGIGVKEQYRTDQVTVSLRLVSVQTKALELETGVATNEPVNYAIRTTIEHAVYLMIHEGVEYNLWKFKEEKNDGIHR